MAFIIIGTLLSSTLIFISFVILIRGLYYLIAGKCKIRGNPLQGREARIVGLVFLLQFPAAMIPLAIIYETYELGRRGGSVEEKLANSLTSDFFAIVFFLTAVVASYLWAKRFAQKNAAAPEHSILIEDE